MGPMPYPHRQALEERVTTLVTDVAGRYGRSAGGDVMQFVATDPEVRDWLRGLGWTPPGEDPASEAADLIRSLIRQRRPGEPEQVVDAHGHVWTDDGGVAWSSATCDESPLATKDDIEVVAGPLVAVQRG